jgi:hypothetical protein
MSSGGTSQPTGNIDEMPSVYREPQPPPPGDEVADVGFVKSIPGILKAVEMIFSLITFICASVNTYGMPAAGWVQFVSMTAFICTIILYIFFLFKLPPKFPRQFPFKFSEFCFYTTFAVFYFISGIVAACFTHYNGYYFPSMAAASFFSFACLLLFGVDAFFHFTDWRSSTEGPYFSSVTTSTSSGQPAGAQY